MQDKRRKRSSPYDGMSEEERKLARSDNRSLGRFAAAFIASCAYGALAFVAVWRIKDALPAFLYSGFSGSEGGNMSRFYIAGTTVAAGLIWLVSFLILWLALARPNVSPGKKVRVYALFCAGACIALLLCRLLTYLTLR